VRVLDKILFRSGSADILPTGQAVLDKLAGVLAATDDMIRVEGHTDFVPIGKQLRQKYYSNWELSAARATSVVRYFEHRHGIDPTRMEAVGFSMFRPVAGDETPEGRQRNRRVEIMLAAPRAPAANE
jgi:chemotaxis protein MotB